MTEQKKTRKELQIDLNMLLMQVANNQRGVETQPQSMRRCYLQREIAKLENAK